MERSEIECNLEIIFQKEINDLRKRVPTCTIEKSGELKYHNAETLIALFASMQNNEELKSFFVESLKERIKDADETSTVELVDVLSGRTFHIGTSSLCFYALVELGFVDDALDALQRRLKP